MSSPLAGERSASCASKIRPISLLMLLGVTAAGLFLRLHQIGSEGFWIDEAFSVWLARHPLGEMVRWVGEVDQHPPLYYALLRGWTTVLGDGEVSARALSALLGGLTIPVVYALGRRLSDDTVGLVAAVILALSPFHVRFAQEARMYALLTLTASLALHAFARLYEAWAPPSSDAGGSCWRGSGAGAGSVTDRALALPWIGYVGFTVAMLWTHNTAVFFPLAANVLVLSRLLVDDRWACATEGWLRRWFVAQAAILLLWLPWLPAFLFQAADVYRRFWLPAPTLGTVASVVGAFLWDFSPWSFPITVALDVGLVGLAWLGLRFLHRHSAPAAVLKGMFLLPFIGQAFVSLWRPILSARTLIWTSIPLYVTMAAGVDWLRTSLMSIQGSRRITLAVLTVLVVINGAALGNYYTTFEKESWGDAATLVAQRLQPDDLLLFNDAWAQIPFDYYFDRQYNPESGPDVVKHGLPVDLFDRGVLEPEMREQDLPRLRTLVTGRQRVWLVYSHEWYTDPQGLIPQALEETLKLQQQWTLEGLQIHLYVRV